MNFKERTYLDRALFYKQQYKETPWWRFKRRSYLYSMWQSALDLMIKSSK
jgi:hypothetical protein